MVFGKSARARFPVAGKLGVSAGPRRRIVGTALAGLILGFGSVTAGTGLVHASERGGLFDFFGRIFDTPHHVEHRPPPDARWTHKKYSSLPDAGHVAAPRQRQAAPRSAPFLDAGVRWKRSRNPIAVAESGIPQSARGQLSVCVRTCDGYAFPLGARASQKDVPLHQAACAAACPDAPTALYTIPRGRTEFDRSVSLTGQPYLAAAWANVYRHRRVENCHCRTPGSVAAPLSIEHDPTLRVGDVVATRQSAAVVTHLARGDIEVEDYRSSPSLSRRARRSVDLRVGALQRDAAERAFRRSMRIVEAGPDRIRLADAGSAQARMAKSGTVGDMGEPALRTPGFAPVRVLVPSPFVY